MITTFINGQYYIFEKHAKRKASLVICRVCGKDWCVRLDRFNQQSSICRSCKIKGAENPLFKKVPHNKGNHCFDAKMHRRAKKAKLILRFGNKCIKCGLSNLPMPCYTFHHLIPEYKVATIDKLMNSKAKLERELKKCVLICENCHRILHHGSYTAEDYK